MDCTDDAVSLNLQGQGQFEEMRKENLDLKFEIDFTKKRLLLKTREIGSIKDNIDRHKKILQKVLLTLKQRPTPDQNDNSTYCVDLDILHETLASLGVSVDEVYENSGRSNKIKIEKLKEEVALLKAKLSIQAKDNEILNINLAKQKSLIEKTAKLVSIQNKELTEVFDELNNIGNSSIEHCDEDTGSELNEILEVTEENDVGDGDYLVSGQKDIGLAVELSDNNRHAEDADGSNDEFLTEEASDLTTDTVNSGYCLQEVQPMKKLAFMSGVGLVQAVELAQVTASIRESSSQPCNLLGSCDASLCDTAAAQEVASTTGYMDLRKRRVRDRALSSCSIQSGYLCDVAQAYKTKCNPGQSAGTKNSSRRKVVLIAGNRKLSSLINQQGCFSGQNKKLMKSRDRILSSCSIQSGFIVGGGDTDQASASLQQKKIYNFQMTKSAQGKAGNMKQTCTLCSKKLLNLKLHMTRVHKNLSEKVSTVQNLGNERVSFTIVTEEVDANGAPIEDLECGMKPQTTIKQVQKSYCKKMELDRGKIRLMLGGKSLWEGQTVKGLGGAKVVAAREGEAGFGRAVGGLEMVLASAGVDELDG